MRCAPRQLAVAQSHLAFAEMEREQGFSSRAQHHLRIADEHARAATLLSPPDRCAGRTDPAAN
jgi:OOP family OmpA-OmpF porin